jgi:hypothetical protein
MLAQSTLMRRTTMSRIPTPGTIDAVPAASQPLLEGAGVPAHSGIR